MIPEEMEEWAIREMSWAEAGYQFWIYPSSNDN